MGTKEILQNAMKQPGITPEEIQEFIDIGTAHLVQVLQSRGWTMEQWHEYRKATVAAETALIDEEIARVTNPGDGE